MPVESNFAEQSSQSGSLVGLNIVFLVAMLIGVAMRLYSRGVLLAFGWDDYICVMAAIASAARSAIVLDNVQLGFGKHLWDIPAASLSVPNARRLASLSVVCPIALCLTRISLLLLYLRQFDGKICPAIWIGICGCAIFYSVSFGIHIGFMVECATPGYLCDTAYSLDVIEGAFGACADVYLLLIPIPYMVNLELPRAHKIGILSMLFAGVVTCFVAVGRLLLVAFTFDSADRFWNAAISSELTTMEINTIITISCLPALSGSVTRTQPRSFRQARVDPSRYNLSAAENHHEPYIVRPSDTTTRRSGSDQRSTGTVYPSDPISELGC